MAARQRVWSWVGAGLLLLMMLVATSQPLQADERLENGGFEQGGSSWAGTGFSTSPCPARTGQSAGGLVTSLSQQVVLVRQTISGVPSAGAYTLTGYARMLSGTATVILALIWQDSAGDEIDKNEKTIGVGGSYASFNLSDSSSPPTASRLIVQVRANSVSAATVCLDDLSLDGPPPATPTPIPTATPTDTPTPTQTPAPTPNSTASPVPTATSTTVPTATPPAPSSTATPDPTATRGTSSGFRFINGGFEDETSGWQKFGGELDAVSSPRRSGSRAGSLTSRTASTKWAFQVVAIEPALAYEFAGYLQTDSAIASAYLRISWYEAADGSGSAVATDDSTARLAGGSGGFVFLTTGVRSPPPQARTARVRVLLTPAIADAASVYMDNLSFGPVAVNPALPPPPPSTTAARDEPIEPPLQAAAASTPVLSPAPTLAPGQAPSAGQTPSAEVAAVVRTPRPRETAAPGLEAPPEGSDGPSDLSTVVLIAGVVLAIGGFGGAYLFGRWRNRQL